MSSNDCCVTLYTNVNCPTYTLPELLYLPTCDTVEIGALCDAHYEMTPCTFLLSSDAPSDCLELKDVYTRVDCDQRTPSPSPSPPPLPNDGCPGDMVFHECGSACNFTCTDPTPVCTQTCVKRCQCPLHKSIWNDHLGACGTIDDCMDASTSVAITSNDSGLEADFHNASSAGVPASFITAGYEMSRLACLSGSNGVLILLVPDPVGGPIARRLNLQLDAYHAPTRTKRFADKIITYAKAHAAELSKPSRGRRADHASNASSVKILYTSHSLLELVAAVVDDNTLNYIMNDPEVERVEANCRIDLDECVIATDACCTMMALRRIQVHSP